MAPFQLPVWLKTVLVGVVAAIAIGAGIFGYRYYADPVTWTVAVGSLDANAPQVVSAIATQLAKANSPVRLKVMAVGTASDAARALSKGTADLAIIRADVGDLSEARTIILVTNGVVMIVVPPGSSIDSIDGLKGKTVGVVGFEINRAIVEALTREYDLAKETVVFKDLAISDVSKALQSKQVSAVLMVLPITDRYLSMLRTAIQSAGKKKPSLIAIDSAGAIEEKAKAYESYALPKGTLWGSPPVPDDDLTTLRVPFYLAANKKLDSDKVADLARAVMNVRRELISEYPGLAQMSAPSTDKDAFIPIHPGAAAYYNDSQQGFFDKYSNQLFYGPMALGAISSGLLAGWKFLGLGGAPAETPLDPLYALARRIRDSQNESELAEVEEEIDNIIKAELVKSAKGDESAADAGILSLVAHRLEYLIHSRRTLLASKPH